MISLRRTITIRSIVMLALVSLLAAVSTFALVAYEMNKFLDAQLQEIAINAGPGDRSEPGPLLESEDEDQLLVRIWDRSGELVHRSGPSIDIPWQAVAGLSDVMAGGQSWRIYRWSHAQHDIQIGQTWSARNEIAFHAAAGAALPLLIAIPFAWMLMGWSINRTLRGLQHLSADIAHRSIDAKEHLQPAGVPSEVAPLIVAIDALITRHQAALELQRRFVADAAHELRTPLAALQIQVDNLIAVDLPTRARELANELQDGVRRASHLASQLLEMARTEGESPAQRENIDVRDMAATLLGDFYPLADARGIQLALTADTACVVTGDAQTIRKLIAILLDNAIIYSESGGVVEIRILHAGDGSCNASCSIEVVDDGPGIPEQAMPFIYDRFFRAAPQGIQGSGLGLAIAKSAADREGIRLSHRNRDDRRGLIACVVLAKAM